MSENIDKLKLQLIALIMQSMASMLLLLTLILDFRTTLLICFIAIGIPTIFQWHSYSKMKRQKISEALEKPKDLDNA